MTEKAKGFIKENIMGIIIACMFTAYWVSDENYKEQDQSWKEQQAEATKKINDRQQVISQCVYNDPDTKPFLKDIIYEWIKIETRGGS